MRRNDDNGNTLKEETDEVKKSFFSMTGLYCGFHAGDLRKAFSMH
ncbi:MAG: hypothetical protein ACLUAR_16935 [Pilosibacter sp.]